MTESLCLSFFITNSAAGDRLVYLSFYTLANIVFRLISIGMIAAAAAAAKSLQSCPTLCDPIDGCPLGSPVPGILQARILEWVAISFSNVCKWKVKVKSLSRVRLLATPWTAAYQAPLPWDFPGTRSKDKSIRNSKFPSMGVCTVCIPTCNVRESMFSHSLTS